MTVLVFEVVGLELVCQDQRVRDRVQTQCMVIGPRDLPCRQWQWTEMSAIENGPDYLLLDHNITTRRHNTVAKQSVQNVLTEDYNLLVTVLDSNDIQR